MAPKTLPLHFLLPFPISFPFPFPFAFLFISLSHPIPAHFPFLFPFFPVAFHTLGHVLSLLTIPAKIQPSWHESELNDVTNPPPKFQKRFNPNQTLSKNHTGTPKGTRTASATEMLPCLDTMGSPKQRTCSKRM